MPGHGEARAHGAASTSSGPDAGTVLACWASLTYGPVGIIAERALANDLADYMRLRAVCRGWWRRCTEGVPRAQGCLPDRRFHPRRGIMLPESATPDLAGTSRCRFRNVVIHECVEADLPELDSHHLLGASAEGLVVIVHGTSYAVRVLNPLTRQRTDLPPLNLDHVRPRCPADLPETLPEYEASDVLSVSGLGLAGDSTVVLCFHFPCPAMVVLAKPGDDRWTAVDECDGDIYHIRIRAATSFSGGFYCATDRNMALAATTPPRMESVAEVVKRPAAAHWRELSVVSMRLVEYDGELLLSRCLLTTTGGWDDVVRRESHVYRVDLDARRCACRQPPRPRGYHDYLDVSRR